MNIPNSQYPVPAPGVSHAPETWVGHAQSAGHVLAGKAQDTVQCLIRTMAQAVRNRSAAVWMIPNGR